MVIFELRIDMYQLRRWFFKMIKKMINRITLFLPIVILWFYNINIFGQGLAQISIPFEVFDNAGGQMTLYFGLDQSATDGIDIHLGESEAPPYPPIGVFDARWILPENNFNGSVSSWSDYRYAIGFPFSGTIENRFRYQPAQGATSMFFSWNLPPEITGLVQDLVNGKIVNIPISGSGTYQIINFDTIDKLKLFIYYNNVISVIEEEPGKPDEIKLNQNYPNPFNPNTIISWQIQVSGWQTLKIFDILGNEVATLINEYRSAGSYEIEFNATSLPGGVYFYQLISGSFIQTNKMVY